MESQNTGGIIGQLDYKNRKVRIFYWSLFAVLILIALICLLPPIWIMLSSLKDVKEFYSVPPTIIPKTFHFNKVWEVWKIQNFTRLYFNTFIMMIGIIVFAIGCNGLMGYFLSKLKPRGSKIVFILVMWTMLLPNTLGMVPVFKNILSFPLIGISLMDTFWPMWLMAGANAFNVIIFKGFFDAIPQSYVEAARIDGGTHLGIFIRIILPLSLPVLVAVTILTMNSAWSDFFWPYMVLRDDKLWTVIVAVFNLQGSVTMDKQVVALTFSILPPALLFIFFQRYIMGGISFSGLKE